ncbi:hypothetical protein UlMin_003796 [Ulmus minor]
MKQKVLIEVQMKCEKCRTKAKEIVSQADGIISWALKGEKRNQIEIIGEGIVDSAGLAEKLTKRVGKAELVSVVEVK